MKPSLAPILVSTLLSALMVTGAIALYDRAVVRPALAVGVVDVAEVYRSKEAEFTQMLTKTTLEDDRQKALGMARAFAQRLPAALEELPRECGCLVLLKSATAGLAARTVDLTPLLRKKVDAP